MHQFSGMTIVLIANDIRRTSDMWTQMLSNIASCATL